jgi:hypothetical protein
MLYVSWLSCIFFKELKKPEYTLHIKRIANPAGDRVRHVTEIECSSMFENLSPYIRLCQLDGQSQHFSSYHGRRINTGGQ